MQETKLKFKPALLTRWLCATPEGRAAYAAARADAAHVWMDETKQIADDCDRDRDAIALAKVQIDTRTMLASKYNRPVFGNDAAQVNVQLNLGQLHLDALRQRAVQVVTAAPLLPSGEPDYEPDDGAPCQAAV